MVYTIVVGVDDSTPSNVAVEWAAARAATMGEAGELFLVHVLAERPDLPEATVGMIRAAGEKLLHATRQLAIQAHPSVPVRTELYEGELVDVMRSVAGIADLVVIGTHKTGFIRGRAIGSRCLHIAAEVQAPLAVVPESARRSGYGIVIGVEESAGGMSALEFAATEGERTRQKVTLVRAWDAPRDVSTDFEMAVSDLERYNAASAQRIMRCAMDIVNRDFPRLTSRSRLVRRPVAEALLNSAASASLLVIGETHHGPGRSSLGAVSHDVLLNLVGPTVLIHSPVIAASGLDDNAAGTENTFGR